ncbi:SfnB family sulfur acquisition oxidoreductase, partial [Acinetobacter baumannii]|nr:SfnB family sulfur acquisition oxidoreductase [Acinetobacter baumannii]
MTSLNSSYGRSQAVPLSVFEQSKDAHIIRSDEEAIEIAKQLAQEFAQEASDRDRERRLPLNEIQQFSQSGLWAITVPKQFGGAQVKYRTLAEVIKTIASVDPSLAQLPQNHLAFIEHLRLDAKPEQQQFFFNLVLRGIRFGNAFSEKHSKTVADLTTKLQKTEHGYEINGKKFFATGALLAHWIPIVAINEQGQPYAALVPRETSGVNIINDWSGFGQRTTASGTVELNQVPVREEYLVPIYQAFERPTPAGAISQFIQAA